MTKSFNIGTARSESLEMYLKAIWHISERGNEVKISSIARLLNIKQPSVVSMLHKLNEENFVDTARQIFQLGSLLKVSR